jgi:hypothetical protein
MAQGKWNTFFPADLPEANAYIQLYLTSVPRVLNVV